MWLRRCLLGAAAQRSGVRAMSANGGETLGRRDEAEEWDVLRRVTELLLDQLSPDHQRQGQMMKQFMEPKEMMAKLPITIEKEGNGSAEAVVSLCQSIIDASVKTAHPFFQNQLFQGADPYGLAASFLTEALNTNVHTYEISPAFQVVESEVVRRLCEYVGWAEGDGTFTPGGSMANMYAISLARYRMEKQLKQKGLYDARPMAIFTSDQCHYSIQKGASFMGFGQDAVIDVKTDKMGAMIPEELEKAIGEAEARGMRPLVVNATEGATVLGSFDPLGPLADICERKGVWLHADACLGGALLLSPKQRHNLAGVERADSVTWNWHKLAGAPLLCSAFLCRHKGQLAAAHGYGAEYLFKRKYYDPAADRGDWSVQCGRKGDAMKVWLMLKARGEAGMASLVDAAVDATLTLTEKLRRHPHFQLVLPEAQCSSVCFWVLSPSVAKEEQGSDAWKAALEQVALRLKERLVKSGQAMVAYQPIASKDLPSFFRFTIACHPGMNEQEMDALLDLMSKHSRDL